MTKHILGWVAWLSGLSLAVLWQLQNIDAFSLVNDEGAYLMWAKLVASGYPLYSETHSVSAPLFIEMLAWCLRLITAIEWPIEPMVQGRIIILGWFIVLASLMSLIGKRTAGWSGLWVALVLVTMPTPLFSLARQVMAEIPATVFALGAVVCVQWTLQGQSVETGKETARLEGRFALFLALSGMLLALSLLMKALYPTAVLSIAYFIIRAPLSWVHKICYGLIFGSVLGLTLLIPFVVYDVTAFYEQAILFRHDLRVFSPWRWQYNWFIFLMYIEGLWGIGLIALAGLICTLRQVSTQAWGIWLAANWLLSMWHSPIFIHHFIIVLVPSLLLAISFVEFCQHKMKWGWGLIGLAALSLPELVQLNQGWTRISTGGCEAVAIQTIKQVTRSDDFVISDSQQLVLFAERFTPPPLGDIALVAIRAGRQDSERLISLSETYQVQAVAPWTFRLSWLPDYLTWVEENYLVHQVCDNDHQFFFGRKHPPQHPIPNEQTWRLGDHILLRGYTVDVETARVGTDLPLTLYWQTEATLKFDYTIFVQILNDQGQLVAQYDSQPLFGYLPSSQWPIDEIIPDRVRTPLPTDLPLGDYAIITGLYNLQTMERLKVSPSNIDYITLTTINISK